MRILVDIVHPAHVHVFRHAITRWQGAGHEVFVTSRRKEIATDLLDRLGVSHTVLSSMGRGGLLGLFGELLRREWALWKIVRRFKPQVMVSVSGTTIAHVGFFTRVPAIVFYDTENATLSNAITYPLAGLVVVPRCYQGWLPRHALRYAGYHELSYLHPAYFTPDRAIAVENGLRAEGEAFFLRTVSWQANHDQFERGWSQALLAALVARLSPLGQVIISSETPLPAELRPYAYRGDPAQVHHVMAFCRLFVGESATMASESAMLGVPAIYAADTGRGYTDEQESRYGLVRNVRPVTREAILEAVEEMLSAPPSLWPMARDHLLAETIDVSRFIHDLTLRFPQEGAAPFRDGVPGEH